MPRRYYTCPRCHERMLPRSREVHDRGALCTYLVECRARQSRGLTRMNALWLGIVREAGVPHERGPASIVPGGPRHDPEVHEGWWAPEWAVMWLNRTLRRSRAPRVAILRALVTDPTESDAFDGAFRLAGWQGVKALVQGRRS